MHPRRARSIADALGRWFEVAARDLSFRRTRDPYAIWVSEIMLQQTRVETVEGYFPRFIERFPDVRTLAAASEDEVLAAWSGLGYYRRARLLHRGARWVVEHHGGQVPRGAASLREIPGVGPYTAGAISSIAFDDPEPLVDGNVARVLSRIEGVEDPREQAATAARHWRDAADIVAKGQPRVLAQALMELGATICTPRAPRCADCPVGGSCIAKAAGRVDAIPAVKVRKPSPTLLWVALALDVGARGSPAWVLVRRPEQGLLARLWTMPLVPAVMDTAAVDGQGRSSVEFDPIDASTEVLALVRRLAGASTPGVQGAGSIEPDVQATEEVRHVFTHQVWRIRPWIVRGLSVDAALAVARATGATETSVYGDVAAPRGGLPTLTRRLIAAAEPARDELSPSRRRRG